MDYPDNELTYYLHDKDSYDDALDLIYDKYKYIIDILINKYKRVFYALNIDIEEVKQEANLAFSYAIHNYNDNKDASLSTFINLVVERKIRNVIKQHETMKSKVNNETLSLNNTEIALENFIGDDTYEPLKKIESIDTLEYINDNVKKLLSKNEIKVYNLMLEGMDYIEIAEVLNKTPKQIDNTIQRIRIKLKKIK